MMPIKHRNLWGRALAVLAVVPLATAVFAGPAAADYHGNDRRAEHERWEHRHDRGYYHGGGGYYVAPPPPVYYAPPAPPPGISLVFPLRIH